MILTVDSIQQALDASPYDNKYKTYFHLNEEATQIVEKATELGYVVRLSHTQAQWTEEGLKKAEKELITQEEVEQVAAIDNCGEHERTIVRIKDTYHLGCFEGTYEQAIEAIKNKYDDPTDYINKINELKRSTLTDYDGDSPKLFFELGKSGLVKSLDYYISKFDDRWDDNDFSCLLADIVDQGNLDMVKYLVEKGADITKFSNLTIRSACDSGHLEIVKYLVSKGVDINASDSMPLHLACAKGHTEVVKYLIEVGADTQTWGEWILGRTTDKDCRTLLKTELEKHA